MADEIVDTFHDYPQDELFREFRDHTRKALDRKISVNPVLNSFQKVVHQYDIREEHISSFLDSMESDLSIQEHDKDSYDTYIFGSAEAVGLMCLHVFVNGDDDRFDELKDLLWGILLYAIVDNQEDFEHRTVLYLQPVTIHYKLV